MEAEHVKADVQYRRGLFTVYGIGLSLIILVPWKLGPPLWSAFLAARPYNMLRITEIGSIVFMLAFIFPSLYLVGQGRRILREGRYPHSGMKVIYDTPIRRGDKAAAVGKRLRLLGLVCIGAALLGSGATHFIFYKFKTDPYFFLKL